ncbi:hypothetical protein [Leifsonia sp. Root4]|uniref:hypothetical protein n=1 Tax=Leifsonia sp. Root4 TaxID=1736525 RepID=UPI000A8D68DD|nr:hypothetical protein [Leifsonia sp. Root4]
MTSNLDHARRYRADHPLYNVWAEMKQRCANPRKHNYSRYGGRGVRVCARWLDSFAAFEADMGPRPDGFTLDRIDNDGPYSPENCRWASMRDQARNKRSNRRLELDGESLTVADWATRTGVPSAVIRQRIDKHKWSVSDALMTPRRTWNRQEISA